MDVLALGIKAAAGLDSLVRLQNRGGGESIGFLIDINEVCLVRSA